MSNTKWTPGPWHAFAMMNTETFAVFGPENDPTKPVVEHANLPHECEVAEAALAKARGEL